MKAENNNKKAHTKITIWPDRLREWFVDGEEVNNEESRFKQLASDTQAYRMVGKQHVTEISESKGSSTNYTLKPVILVNCRI